MTVRMTDCSSVEAKTMADDARPVARPCGPCTDADTSYAEWVKRLAECNVSSRQPKAIGRWLSLAVSG